jgi:hypothetical protein
MNINSYFELYLHERVKYDRLFHIKNMKGVDFNTIDNRLIKRLFTYLDNTVFNGNLTKYAKDNNFELKFNVSKSLTSTAGMFYWRIDKTGKKTMGFKMSYKFFNDIVKNNTLNLDLGVVDHNNKPYLSTNTAEPLFATFEHEIIHMLMFVTRDNKLNDYKTVKSGHTKCFKTLVYNIFGHYRVTHSYSVGDIKESNRIRDEIVVGDIVKDTARGESGYVVGKKKNALILCISKNGTNTYIGTLYKNAEKVDVDPEIDIKLMINRLHPNIKIRYKNIDYTIKRINNMTIKASTSDNKIWTIPLYLILDIQIL